MEKYTCKLVIHVMSVITKGTIQSSQSHRWYLVAQDHISEFYESRNGKAKELGQKDDRRFQEIVTTYRTVRLIQEVFHGVRRFRE